MLKRLTLPAMSVVALLAFAAPTAQATGPLITNIFGQATGTIGATSTNFRINTAVGVMECRTVNLDITITTNANTTAKGNGSGTAEGTFNVPKPPHTGHCGTLFGNVVEFTSVTVSDFHLTKHGSETTGTASFSFTYDLRSATGSGLIAECTFGGTVPVKKTGTSTINVEGEIPKTAGGAFCPGTGTMKGDYDVIDESGIVKSVIH